MPERKKPTEATKRSRKFGENPELLKHANRPERPAKPKDTSKKPVTGSFALTQGYVPGNMPFSGKFKPDVKLDDDRIKRVKRGRPTGRGDSASPSHDTMARGIAVKGGQFQPSQAWIDYNMPKPKTKRKSSQKRR